jgi:hypothetical protein
MRAGAASDAGAPVEPQDNRPYAAAWALVAARFMVVSGSVAAWPLLC